MLSRMTFALAIARALFACGNVDPSNGTAPVTSDGVVHVEQAYSGGGISWWSSDGYYCTTAGAADCAKTCTNWSFGTTPSGGCVCGCD
jgi:hypothetical protein